MRILGRAQRQEPPATDRKTESPSANSQSSNIAGRRPSPPGSPFRGASPARRAHLPTAAPISVLSGVGHSPWRRHRRSTGVTLKRRSPGAAADRGSWLSTARGSALPVGRIDQALTPSMWAPTRSEKGGPDGRRITVRPMSAEVGSADLRTAPQVTGFASSSRGVRGALDSGGPGDAVGTLWRDSGLPFSPRPLPQGAS